MKRIWEDTLFFIIFCLLLINANAQTGKSQSTSKPLEAVYDQSTDESTVRLSRWFIVANVPGLPLNGNANSHGSPLVNPTIEKPEVIRMLVRLKYRGKDVQVPNSVNIMFDATSS